MKTLIYILFIWINMSCIAQIEVIHTGIVIGSFEFANQEVTTIYDETSDCVRKTSPHTKNLFIPSEPVLIRLKEVEQTAEITKSDLAERVFAAKLCYNINQNNCLSGICIIENDANNLLLKYNLMGYTILYSASQNNTNSIKSRLILSGGNMDNSIILTSYLLDRSDVHRYKLSSYKGVLQEANKLIHASSIQINDTKESIVQQLVIDLKEQIPNIVEFDLAQNVFFHVAILKSAKRAIENNNTECDCATAPLYFKEGNPFLCQEDLSYNIRHILDNLDNNLPEILNLYGEETTNYVKVYLESKENTKSIISFEEVYLDLSDGIPASSFNTYLEEVLNAAPCLQGTALGCCGNYSGCCWLSSYACWVHDVVCLKCDLWHCGWGCVPI